MVRAIGECVLFAAVAVMVLGPFLIICLFGGAQ
ncbi:hypothetical protein UFOVP130_68 [uncultured Caudovirales phage]|uniref:Uncharacterized protein n=1 Tax=uncultured Caudovirales phage TaxID=2100421 RepID=A0A6J5LDH8_9CAUD|nr:hypothetical protein UFOVP130_68 [uncultured Caudovirales phage]